MRRAFHFDEERITLPKGTRVVLRTALRAEDGHLCKAGTVGTVVALDYDRYRVRTPAGRELECQRDQLVIQRREALPALAARQLDFAALREHVIYASVVGSTAWGLAGEGSDEDVKGVFLLPFEGFAGLWDPVDEIQDPERDLQYWEVQKLVYQGLRADANTLEMLWSPLVKVETELGAELRAGRRMFVSRQIFGTFGRYAMSQFRKLRTARRRREVERAIVELLVAEPELPESELVRRLCGRGLASLAEGEAAAREAVRDLYRSLFDRGLLAERGYAPLAGFLAANAAEALAEDPLRWKNAYNLVRLLASGIRWLREGEPLIAVEGALREELLAIKRGETPLEEVLARADELALELERAAESTRLPENPDYEAAHAFLLHCREHAAAVHLARPAPVVAAVAAAPPPPSERRRFPIPEEALRAFLARHRDLDVVVASLVGSHSYGFPSRDSDFDLKAIHLAPAEAFLGLTDPPSHREFLGVVDGLELDFTSHEARPALQRLLRGDGNVLERIFSPYQLLPEQESPRLAELRAAARDNLSRRCYGHYGGFFRQLARGYAESGGGKIKTLLYLFRVALSGVHLLREREVLADLGLLLERYPFAPVHELFRLKEEAELAQVADDRPYRELIPRLEALLVEAHERSPLPEVAPEPEALDAWLRRWRARA
jgi:predicted nucleotidyltransferase